METGDPRNERRKAPRVRAGLAARFATGMGEEAVSAETLNLSRAGVSCVVPQRMKPLTKVEVTLLVPEVSGGASGVAVVSATAVVVRAEPRSEGGEWEIACAFLSLPEDGRRALDAYVSSRLNERASAAPRDLQGAAQGRRG